jgi:hypothetical protein
MSPDYIRPVPTINLTADELEQRQSGAPSKTTDFPTPRASISCARRWESSRRPQS